VDEGGDGPVARARDRHVLALDHELNRHRRPGLAGRHLMADKGDRRRLGQVLLGEPGPHLGRLISVPVSSVIV